MTPERLDEIGHNFFTRLTGPSSAPMSSADRAMLADGIELGVALGKSIMSATESLRTLARKARHDAGWPSTPAR